MTEGATDPVLNAAQRKALASPLRVEIVGLFAYAKQFSIAEMAEQMGVPAGSLYHHVGLLEEVEIIRRAGSRRKGKRDAALFELARTSFEIPVEADNEEWGEDARRTLAAAFRMAERDFVHALDRDDIVTEGEARNLIAMRMHFRASPRLLSRVNKHVDAILDLLAREQSKRPKRADSEEGQHVSLTLALLPLKGRGAR